MFQTGEKPTDRIHILRASIRDRNNQKYVFILDSSESWKLAKGLQRLRKGSQVRSLQNANMGPGEVNRVLSVIPPMP